MANKQPEAAGPTIPAAKSFEYRLVSGTPDVIVAEVNRLLNLANEDWTCIGGPFKIRPGAGAQAMIKTPRTPPATK